MTIVFPQKNFKELKWRNRWSQLEIVFNCPIAPLKKDNSAKVESITNLQNFFVENKI